MHTVDDTSFNRVVLKAPLPSLALFHASSCEISRSARAGLAGVAAGYKGRVRIATIDTDAHGSIAEQLGVWALPSYVAFLGGDEVTRVCGFLPAGLLRCLFDLILADTQRVPRLWRPTEQQFEDDVLVPMLARWDWVVQRQQRCALPRSRTGVVDLLVSLHGTTRPLSLFENKRLISSDDDLRRAATQARRYALALDAPSFVVADPMAVWVYAPKSDAPLARFAVHALEADAGQLRELLLALA